MITRAELLARLHGESAAKERSVQPALDLTNYASAYGYELADLARRVLGLVRFRSGLLRVLELHPGSVALASAFEGARVCAVEPQPDAARRLERDGVEVTRGHWPERRPEGRFDLVVGAGLSSAYSEHELREELAPEMASLLAPFGQVLILESGHRQGGRAVVAWREGLMRQRVQPIAPCPHQLRCPLAQHRRKGCTFPFAPSDEEAELPVDPAADELAFLLAGRDASVRRSEPFVIARAQRDQDRVVLPVCHETHAALVAPIGEHTRRGGGLYRQQRGCYVEVPPERLDSQGELLAGGALPAGEHVLDQVCADEP